MDHFLLKKKQGGKVKIVQEIVVYPLTPRDWPKQSFSLHYQSNARQTSDENKNIKKGISSWSITQFSKLTL